eukprot:1141408-Pelagomonas_calceolata.AAC.1
MPPGRLGPRRPDSPSPCIHLRAPSTPRPPEAPSKQRACSVLIVVVSLWRDSSAWKLGILLCVWIGPN